jgi:uncharacterized phage protein (TIGR01671 family)
MREILFRGKAKTIKRGEWIEGSLVNTYDWYTREQHCFIVDDDYQDHDEWEVDPQTVGQYTGLKDKNGKRIFEGDILEFWQPEFDLTDKSWGIVRYFADEDYPAFDIETLNVDSNGLSYIMANCECEIIGNIHDNPELLEGQK